MIITQEFCPNTRKSFEVKHIDKTGIELEGNFEEIPFWRSGHFTSDGSVHGFEHLSSNYCRCGYHDCQCTLADHKSGIGEYVSDPLNPDEVDDWISQCHPTETNRSCGGHVHVSMKNLYYYMQIMTPEFYQHLMDKMHDWGLRMEIHRESPFWDRISKDGTEFNFGGFNARDQKNMRRDLESPRYKQINYCFNLHDRHTVEFRFLPVFKQARLQVSATLEILRVIEEYLSQTGEERPRVFNMEI